MEIVIIMGIALLITFIFTYKGGNKVGKWMNERRLEAWNAERVICPQCGKIMKPGERKKDGMKLWYCSSYPKCTYVIDNQGRKSVPLKELV